MAPLRLDAPRRSSAEIEFEEPTVLGALFGQFDVNLVQIESRLGVFISARGNRIHIEGPDDAVARAREVLRGMHQRLLQGQELDSGAVESLITMSAEPTLDGIVAGDAGTPSVMIRTRKKTIVPRSATQIPYMQSLGRDEIIFALGPAGTGKTYLAVAQAVSQLMTGSVQRLILSRPAVEAGERLGFLPGDMKERSILICVRFTMRSMIACRPNRLSGGWPAARLRLPPSPSCAGALWPMLS